MLQRVLIMSFTFLLALSLSILVLGQEGSKNEESKASPAQGKANKAAKQDRWEGKVVRSNLDKSTLTVRKVGSSLERIVRYDSSTHWVSQEHGSKTVNDIDASQVKDGDRVICKGTWDKDRTLHASLISKRLSHSPR